VIEDGLVRVKSPEGLGLAVHRLDLGDDLMTLGQGEREGQRDILGHGGEVRAGLAAGLVGRRRQGRDAGLVRILGPPEDDVEQAILANPDGGVQVIGDEAHILIGHTVVDGRVVHRHRLGVRDEVGLVVGDACSFESLGDACWHGGFSFVR
jgi:hypothetical protein